MGDEELQKFSLWGTLEDVSIEIPIIPLFLPEKLKKSIMAWLLIVIWMAMMASSVFFVSIHQVNVR